MEEVDFLLAIGGLKSTLRKGWVLRGVAEAKVRDTDETERPRVESVADHSWRMGMMASLLKDNDVDKGRVARLALVHDLAETVTGDITPFCNVSKEEKEKREVAAMRDLVEKLPEHSQKEVDSLWKEYEERSSKEARLVKDFDLFEMILQAYQYELAYPEQNLGEFFDSVEGRIKNDEVKCWEKALREKRSCLACTNDIG